MIIRVFSPTIHPGKEEEFESFLRDTAVPLVSRQAGLLAQHVGRSVNVLHQFTSPSGKTPSRSKPLPAAAGRRP